MDGAPTWASQDVAGPFNNTALPDHRGSLEVGQHQDVEELGPGRRWKGVQPIAEHLLELGIVGNPKDAIPRRRSAHNDGYATGRLIAPPVRKAAGRALVRVIGSSGARRLVVACSGVLQMHEDLVERFK